MEENGSLYQPPSRSSSPSVPTATPAPPAPPAPPSPRPPPERSNTARVDLPERSKKTSYGQYPQPSNGTRLKLTHYMFLALNLSTSRWIGVVASPEAMTSTGLSNTQTKTYTISNRNSARRNRVSRGYTRGVWIAAVRRDRGPVWRLAKRTRRHTSLFRAQTPRKIQTLVLREAVPSYVVAKRLRLHGRKEA